MEGGFSKTLLMTKEHGKEVVAKLPTGFVGSSQFVTASEVTVMQYLHDHTKVPVPKIPAWNSDASNPVGAKYIIMEKGVAHQLFNKLGELDNSSHLHFIQNLCKVEANLTAIAFPANGSLYLRDSMGLGDEYKPLAPEMDAFEGLCIGPSCERSWFSKGDKIYTGALTEGHFILLGITLPDVGVALAEREIARVEENPKVVPDGPPRGSPEEQFVILKLAKEVFLKMDAKTIPGRFKWPTLWHTDLHMGNIYVSDENPAQISCVIDWQSTVVLPLIYQVRFPELITIDDDYELGLEAPKLLESVDEMNDDNQKNWPY